MSRTRILQNSRTAAILVAAGGASALYPRQAWAEAPAPEELPDKKPIYSPFPIAPTTPKPSSTSPVSQPNPTSPTPTPTDRLATSISHARVWLYKQSGRSEDALNNALSYAFKKEENFTNTIASLAPSPETGEQLLPGAIYVLVATLAGSIVSRNRGIFLRATVPFAVGITAGWMLIPVTMRNTSDLIWEYEKRVPVIADSHAFVGGFARQAWKEMRERGKIVAEKADNAAVNARQGVEGWVEKGK